MLSALLAQIRQGLLDRPRRLVRPHRGQGVEDINHSARADAAMLGSSDPKVMAGS